GCPCWHERHRAGSHTEQKRIESTRVSPWGVLDRTAVIASGWDNEPDPGTEILGQASCRVGRVDHLGRLPLVTEHLYEVVLCVVVGMALRLVDQRYRRNTAAGFSREAE